MILLNWFCSLENGWNNQWLMLTWLNINNSSGDKCPQSWHWLCSKRMEFCKLWTVADCDFQSQSISSLLIHLSSRNKGKYVCVQCQLNRFFYYYYYYYIYLSIYLSIYTKLSFTFSLKHWFFSPWLKAAAQYPPVILNKEIKINKINKVNR